MFKQEAPRMVAHVAFAAALGFFMLGLSGGAHAQMYRCVGSSGKVTYTDQPCPEAREQREVSIVDNSSDSAALRQRISRGAATPASAEPPAGAMALTPGRSNDPRDLAAACPARKRDYEIAVSTIKKDLQTMNKAYALASRSCGPSFEVLPAHHKYMADARAARKQQGRGHASQTLPPVFID